MTRFEPAYINYGGRITRAVTTTIITIIILVIASIVVHPNKFAPYVFIIAGVIFIVKAVLDIRKKRSCLTAIIFDGQMIEIHTVFKDEPQPSQQFSIEKTRVKITEMFFSSRQRTFKLQIDAERNGRYLPVAEQSETGNWHLELFKEIYLKYCEIKNIPANVSAYRKTNF